MKNIQNIGNSCVGCRSCELSCPRQCISFKTNLEGFLYPVINTKECINCGQCSKHCPVNNKNIIFSKPINIYGLINKNRKDILKSASGGASDVIARHILQNDGVVFGCAYNENLSVCHIAITDISDLWKIQSSKYVQSDIKECYKECKQYVQSGKYVLFTGTPCQIAGLYAYLGENSFKNLFTLDLICHGVPSPLLFSRYIGYLEKKIHEKILYYNFRYKGRKGWGTYYYYYSANKSKTGSLDFDKYGMHFLNGDCYRESCYNCMYAKLERVSDITVGDFWGIEKVKHDIDIRNGVSMVLVNSLKGKYLLDNINENTIIFETDKEKSIIKQNNLKKPTTRPESRNFFYCGIENEDFFENMKLRFTIKKIVKLLIPDALKIKIKRYL